MTTEAPTSDAHAARDELDPELLALPSPPKGGRTLTVGLLALTALASVAMVLLLWRDAAYALAPESARSLGNLSAAPAATLRAPAFVEADVALGAARAIRYERPLASGSFRLMPVAKASAGSKVSDIWVEVRVPPGAESSRWVPPSRVTGRLVRFGSAGPRHRGLAEAVRDATGAEVPEKAWLLIDGATPASARWAALLVLLFGCFAAWSAWTAARLVRAP